MLDDNRPKLSSITRKKTNMKITIARPMRNTKYAYPEDDGELREVLFEMLKDSWDSYISSWTVDEFDRIKRSTIDPMLLELMALEPSVTSTFGPVLKKKCAEASQKKEWLELSIETFTSRLDELRDFVTLPMDKAIALSVNFDVVEQLQIDILISYFKPLFPLFVLTDGEWETMHFPLYEAN